MPSLKRIARVTSLVKIPGQTIGDIVGKFERLGLVGEGDGGQHRAENFLLCNTHRRVAPVNSVGAT